MMEEFVLAIIIILIVAIVGHIDISTTGWVWLIIFGVSIICFARYRRNSQISEN